jgi:hypothetical protein
MSTPTLTVLAREMPERDVGGEKRERGEIRLN